MKLVGLLFSLIAFGMNLSDSGSPPKDCKTSEKGTEYTGKINKTPSGKTCQAWNTKTPHSHNMDDYPFSADGGIDNAKNYCRNPDGTGWIPWCYTTDSELRWEYCNIPKCAVADCKRTEKGLEYTGKINVTPSGKTCQDWASQYPHKHSMTNFSTDGGIRRAKNYCRNPDNSGWIPWCYTTSSGLRWEYCDIPTCEDSEDSEESEVLG